MENFDDKAIDREVATLRRQRDSDDLQNEVAGREVGRIARFLPEDVRNPEQSEKRKAERAEMLTRLQLMMRDPAYAALYRDTTDGLRKAQGDLDRMREQAQRILDEENEALARIDARAARDSEGRAVFKDQSGETRYANGALVAEEEAAGIVWRGDEPGFEERQAHADRRGRAEDIIADIDAGQAEIGDMQDDLLNDDDPKSADEMEGMTERASEIQREAQAGITEIVRSPVAEPELHPVSTFARSTPGLPQF